MDEFCKQTGCFPQSEFKAKKCETGKHVWQSICGTNRSQSSISCLGYDETNNSNISL